MSASPVLLDALRLPLRGSRLIEASAGTGKTWTIAALYVRLVLGHGGAEHGPVRPLMPQDILVMTFTRAATRELSDRIRARLGHTAATLRAPQCCDPEDSFMVGLLQDFPSEDERQRAAHRLTLAAQAMDDAAVDTIDAWCQRMLREHAFDSGSLFDETLVADEAALRLEAAQDYWRVALYPMAAEPLRQVLAIWPDVAALERELQRLLNVDWPQDGELPTLAQVLAQVQQARAQALAQLKTGWAERADALRAWLAAALATPGSGWKKSKFRAANVNAWLDALKAWAQGDGDAQALQTAMGKTGWARFTPEGMAECREDGAGPGALPPECAALADLQVSLAQLPEPRAAARAHAGRWVAQRLAWLKRRSAQFGFADMLQRLDTALHRPGDGERLAERLRAQYPAAMVDEFQDTSPLQFRLFDRIYRCAENRQDAALLLIGDPKQSIYGFRGADILSYLQARRATAGRHHVLGTNRRSTEALVAVVNRWFEIGEARVGDGENGGAFGHRQADGDNPVPFQSVSARGRPERLMQGEHALPAMTLVHDLQVRPGREAQARLAALCAEQIVAWLGDATLRFVQEGQADRRLQPKDIAVLVRTGQEAEAVRQALRARGVASVYLSDRDSVFASDEARDLALWLRGVAEPQDMRRVRAALATATVGLSLAELHTLAEQGELLDARAEQLRELRQVWQRQGVLAMLRQSLHRLQLAQRWRAQLQGERRLTNVLHLAELLQSASTTLDGEQALIRWLDQQMQEAGSAGDEQIVRLESDEDLVKVVTVHSSKGLEYPLVCLPFAHSHRRVNKKGLTLLSLSTPQGQREHKLQFDADDIERADAERLREDLRLWYVALTRPQHALWIGWAAVRSGNSAACVNHHSASGHLLGGGAALDGPDWLGALQALRQDAQGQALSVALQAAPESLPLTRWQRGDDGAAWREAMPCTALIDTRWTIASFSRLARELSAQPVLHTSVPRPADDEPLPDALAAPTAAPERGSAPWHRFAKGPSAGNFLHDQLEWLAAERFPLAPGSAQQERLRRRCQRSAYEAQAEAVVDWLGRVVSRRLAGPQVALCELQSLLPEMEFWLPAERLDAQRIDALCSEHLWPGLARPRLPEARLHGMLMGFADLVFEHQGRYWVLDYKSNHLGEDDAAYSAPALQAAMAQHRYDVQAALYLLALHRLLRARLGAGYVPAQQLGGAVYLFLRGIDGPEAGCCTLPCSPALLALLDGLDAMLGEEVTP